MLGIEVSEIHAYPLKPKGFEEPLFPTTASKRAVAEHLLQAPWLARASEVGESSGECSRVLNEAVELREARGYAEIVRLRNWSSGLSWRRKRILRALERWREVGHWWDEDRSIDRMVFRVLLSGRSVVELALERSGNWFLTGVAD